MREERLFDLIQELVGRPEYATGAEPFPRSLERVDAITIASEMQIAIDEGTEARAQVIAQTGAELACRAGCAACCDQMVGVFAAEAELITAWLNDDSDPARAEIRAAFLAAYPRWLELTGDRVARISVAPSGEQQEIALEQFRARVRCAFNREGLCSIYPVRPIACRTVHAVDTPDRCHPADSPDEPRTLHFVPLEEFKRKMTSLHLAMHHALGGPRLRPEVLCVAVYERLTRR